MPGLQAPGGLAFGHGGSILVTGTSVLPVVGEVLRIRVT